MYFTTVIASCLANPDRLTYLKQTIAEVRAMFPNTCNEIIVLFDKIGLPQVYGATKCITHNKGLGFSFNEGIRQASNDLVLQMEDDWIKNFNVSDISDGFIDNVYKLLKAKKGILRTYNEPLFYDYSKKIAGWVPKCHIYSDPVHHVELIKATSEEIKERWNLRYRFNNSPHFKLKSFLKDVGEYSVNVAPPYVETDMLDLYDKSDYSVFYMNLLFCHNGWTSIRDVKLPKITKQYRCEQVSVLGASPFTVYLNEQLDKKVDYSPFNTVYISPYFLKYLFTNGFDKLKEIIQSGLKHYDEGKIFCVSYPYNDIQSLDDKKRHIDGINKFEDQLKTGINIGFIYCNDPCIKDNITFGSSVFTDTLNDMKELRQIIKTNYPKSDISISVIAFEDGTNEKLEYKYMKYDDNIRIISFKKKQSTEKAYAYKIINKEITVIKKLFVDIMTDNISS